MVLLQIRTTPLGQGLLKLVMLLFNHLVCGIMPVIDRKPISVDNDDKHHRKLMQGRAKMTQTMKFHKYLYPSP